MSSAKITSKGQITVPRDVREALGVGTGDRLVFRKKADGEIVVEAATVDFRSLAGVLKPKRRGATLEQIQEAIRKGWTGA